jgi:homospermidine synthase
MLVEFYQYMFFHDAGISLKGMVGRNYAILPQNVLP